MKRSSLLKFGVLVSPLLGLAIYAFIRIREPTVEALIDPDTRLRTFHMMWAQQESSNKHDFYKPILKFSNFKSRQNEMVLLEISQGNASDKPLYLLLRDQQSIIGGYPTPPWSSWKRAADFSNWKEWFSQPSHSVIVPPLAKPTSDPITSKYIISLHASDGTLMDEFEPRPFAGNNLTSNGEVIYDINQDGWVERVTDHSIGFLDSDVGGKLLSVTRINNETEMIFRVLIGVDNPDSDPKYLEEWGYRVEDTDGDGILEIQIGEVTAGTVAIEPRVTFFWDDKAGAFLTKSPEVGPHYRVLDPKGDWKELQQLLDAGKLAYPLDQP